MYLLINAVEFPTENPENRLDDHVFQSFPWLGGYSAVGFYNNLKYLTPLMWRPKIIYNRVCVAWLVGTRTARGCGGKGRNHRKSHCDGQGRNVGSRLEASTAWIAETRLDKPGHDDKRLSTKRTNAIRACPKSCHKSKFVVFIRNGRITIALSGGRRKMDRPRADSCNLSREVAQPGKGSQDFFI